MMASAERMGLGNVYDEQKDCPIVCRSQIRASTFSYGEKVNFCGDTCYFLECSTIRLSEVLWQFLLNSKYRFFSVHSTAEIYDVGLHPATRLVISSIHCVYCIPGARLVCRDFTRPSPLACSGWGLVRETSLEGVVCR